MDGFDLGTAILLPFLGRTDMDRRIMINTVGPVWEGNQVWLILGGGAIFAAWPPLYAVAFSGFYLAMLLLLLSLILRPVGFKFRSKLEDTPLAHRVGHRAVHRRPGARAGVRRRLRQCAAGRAVPLRRHAAHDLHRHVVRSVQSVRAAVRPGQRGDDRHARRRLAGLQDRGAGARACPQGRRGGSAGAGGAVRRRRVLGGVAGWLRRAEISPAWMRHPIH